MGSLRMTGSLKEMMRKRFPGSFLPLGELVPGEDGKMRYFKPLRVDMYRKVLDWVRDKNSTMPVYACMERPSVWREVFQGDPDAEELGQQIVHSLVG